MNSGIFLSKITAESSVYIIFGVDGFAEYEVEEGFYFVVDFIQLDNGKLLICGFSFQDAWIIMDDLQGNLVTDFGNNGFVDTNIRSDVNRIFLAQNGDQIIQYMKKPFWDR